MCGCSARHTSCLYAYSVWLRLLLVKIFEYYSPSSKYNVMDVDVEAFDLNLA